MNLHRTWIVFFKEFRDIIRDRRTLISMVLLPILLFPVVMLGATFIMKSQIEKAQKKVSKVAWIAPDNMDDLRQIVAQIPDIVVMPGTPDSADAVSMIRGRELVALLIVPPAFRDSLDAVLNDNSQAEAPAVMIYSNQTRTQSEFAVERIINALQSWRASLTENSLKQRNLSPQLVKPFMIGSHNIATPKEMGGFVMGSFLPYILILMALTGAMYPAIDLTAGEKERGTLETLLVSGVARLDIVLGKFLTVFSASLITSVLAVLSLSLTGLLALKFLPEAAGKFEVNLAVMDVALMIMAMLPLAVIFSSLLMSIALFAKSYREAQSYISPLMFLVIFPAMASMMPDMENSRQMAVIPIMNVSVLLKNGLAGHIDLTATLLTMAINLTLAAFCLYLVLRMFKRESVLFRI